MDKHKTQNPEGGFLVRDDAAELWLRRDGVLLAQTEGAAPFHKQHDWNDVKYASRPFVQGQSLREFCTQIKLELPLFVKIMHEAMKGLVHLHEKGMAHGRIHSGNIILTAHDSLPIWVDHSNEGTPLDDWNDFWSMLYSLEKNHDVGVEFFCVQLRKESEKKEFLEQWSSSSDLSLWDKSCILDVLCSDFAVEPKNEGESFTDIMPPEGNNSLSKKQAEVVLNEEESLVWKRWIEEGKEGKELALQFLETFPLRDPQTLLHCVCEGILLGRIEPKIVAQYEQLFGLGAETEQEILLAETSLQAAQAVCDLEKEIEQLESLSWYERNFGEAKEALLLANERFLRAIQEREKYLPKLVPRARGLLDHDVAYRIATKKHQKILDSHQETHEWRSWFPKKVYSPQPPHSLERAKVTLSFEGETLRFCRMPQGFWGDIPMNHTMWISDSVITQSMYKKITGNQSSWMQGENIPAHMITQGEAYHFCNRLSEYFSLPLPYLFSGGTWSYVSQEGFALLTHDEWSYAASASGRPSHEEIQNQAWCSKNSKGKIQPIREKNPNDWGLFDMFGGMEEWVWCSESSRSSRVGGSWYHDSLAARNLALRKGSVNLKSDTIGFRIRIYAMIPEGVKGVSLG